MNFTTRCTVTLVGLLVMGFANAAAILGLNSPDRIDGDYIVVLSDHADPVAVAATAEEWQLRYAIDVEEVYTTVINGMHVRTDSSTIEKIAADPRVAYVEANQKARIGEGSAPVVQDISASFTQPTSSWGLDRIDERGYPLDGAYSMSQNGRDVHVYVVDTGIAPNATEFGTRVNGGTTFVNDGRGTADCHYHGTFVAGIVGSSSWGVAKLAQLHPVRVADCNADFDHAKVLSALEWVAKNHRKPAIVNLSIGLRWFLKSAEQATDKLIDMGVIVVGGSGNNNTNSCGYYFPSTVARVIIVGATNDADQRAWFSDLGACVDLHAPGEDVRSVYFAGGSGTTSGTSFAAPYVTGVAALYLSDSSNSQSPADVAGHIRATSTAHTIGGIAGSHSTNRLVYSLLDWPERLDPNGTRMPNRLRVQSEHCRGLNSVTWEKPEQAGTFRYELELSANADFSSAYVEYAGSGTNIFVNIPVGTTRYVRLRATRDGGYAPSYPLISDVPATSTSGCN
jgi:subtilisin family serine protease